MAVDMFLKIDGVEGESTDDKHKGEIEILSFSWGVSQSGGFGPGGGAGKVSSNDFAIVKRLDKATPQLLEKVCQGEHIGSALLTLAKAGGDHRQEYLKIKLTDIIISSYQTSGASSGEPAEQVSFAFQSVEVSAAEIRQDGSIGGWKETAGCHFGGKVR